MDQVSEASDVKSMVPKFVRKWSSEEDDGNLSNEEDQSENAVLDEHVLADNSKKQQ
jgi:hypothetical protein